MVSKKFYAEDQGLNCEVMIVGGGPAGISTWLHLHKHAPGLAGHTLVVEKAVFPRDKLCAGGIGGWCADVFEHLEIKLDVPAVIVSDVEFRCGKNSFHLHRPGLFRVVQRLDFDAALVETAVSRGLKLHEGEKLVDVARDDDRLMVTTSRRRYRARILVGADGAFSAVRRKTMPPHQPCFAPTLEVFAKARAPLDREFSEKKMVVDLGPVKEGLQGYIWHIPCLKNNTPSIIHGICDFHLYRDRPRANMKKLLQRELAARKIYPGPTSYHSHPICCYSAENPVSQPNILLVGDAAGIEPAFGGGIHIALSYGEVAARAIRDAYENRDFFFKDYKERLQSHLVGEWISECSQQALEMYGGKSNPLEVARRLFADRRMPPDLMSEMLGEIAAKLKMP